MQSQTSSGEPRSLGDYYADRLGVIGRNLIAGSAMTNTLALPLSRRETHALAALRSLRARRAERLASLVDANAATDRAELMMLEADFAATLGAAHWWMADLEQDDERAAARLLSDPDLVDLPGIADLADFDDSAA